MNKLLRHRNFPTAFQNIWRHKKATSYSANWGKRSHARDEVGEAREDELRVKLKRGMSTMTLRSARKLARKRKSILNAMVRKAYVSHDFVRHPKLYIFVFSQNS